MNLRYVGLRHVALLALAGSLVGCGDDGGAKLKVSDKQLPNQSIATAKSSAAELEIFRPFADALLKRTYGALYAECARRNPAFEPDRLHQIILAREVALFSLNRRNYRNAQEQKEAVKKVRTTFADEIQQKLGAAVLKAFDDYELDRKYHQILSSINQTLLFRGAPLSLEQMEFLVALLKENDSKVSIMSLSEAEMEKYIQARKQAHASMLAEMAPRLTAVQLEEVRLEFETEVRYLRYYAMRNAQTGRGALERDAPELGVAPIPVVVGRN